MKIVIFVDQGASFPFPDREKYLSIACSDGSLLALSECGELAFYRNAIEKFSGNAAGVVRIFHHANEQELECQKTAFDRWGTHLEYSKDGGPKTHLFTLAREAAVDSSKLGTLINVVQAQAAIEEGIAVLWSMAIAFLETDSEASKRLSEETNRKVKSLKRFGFSDLAFPAHYFDALEDKTDPARPLAREKYEEFRKMLREQLLKKTGEGRASGL